METFQIKRFGVDENQENEDQQQNLLLKLKQKIADAGSSVPEIQKEEIKETEDSKSKKKRKRKKKSDSNEDKNDISGFTKLGVFTGKDQVKVRRVLPKWLAEPDIVSVDLGDQQMPVKDMTQLHSSLLDTLQTNGIEYFFPVQRQVIPHLLDPAKYFRPSDVCVSAPTGSGKTLAFVLPIVHSLMSRTVPRVRALVILPVQDLAMQVFKVFRTYTEKTNLRVKLLSGQKSFAQEQTELVLKGVDEGTFHSLADIIVATPGRLVDHLQKTPGFSLSHLRYLIIDEADRVMEDVQNDWLTHVESAVYANEELRPKPGPLNAVPKIGEIPLQKLLFSATLSQNPEKLQQLKLYEPKLYTSVVDPNDILAKSTDDDNFVGQFTTPKELQESILLVENSLQKPLLLVNLIKQKAMKKVLIFTKSIENSHNLCLILKAMDLKVAEMSSQLKKGKRGKILSQFKNDKIDVMVATDALARGIDIGTIDFVLSYDCPKFIKTYIHRIGRTARAGRSGHAITLIESKQLRPFKSMLKQVSKNSDLIQEDIKIQPDIEKTYEKVMQEISKNPIDQ